MANDETHHQDRPALRVGVVGAGRLGTFHARLLAATPGVTLIGVADPMSAARNALAGECRTLAFGDYRNLLGRIDAAVIAAPTRLHHEIGQTLLAAGIHCLMEKPIAATTAEADDLIASARRHGVVLQVGHIERFNPAFVEARPVLGSPKFLESARHTPYTFRSTDVGVVLDLMIHDLDIVLSLVDAPLRAVDGFGLAVLGPHEDVAHARLTFENGTVAQLSASRVSYHPARRLHVWSPAGFAAVNYAEREVVTVGLSKAIRERTFHGDELPQEEKAHLAEHLFEELLPLSRRTAAAKNALVDEQADFFDSIRDGRSPQVPGEAGRAALAAAEHVLRAIDEHSWDGHADGRFGPLAEPHPSILRGPHFPVAPAVDMPRREAG